MPISVLNQDQVLAKIREKSYPAQSSYYAMYSSWWNGVVKDPSLMMIPVDDHVVHRGDGVFEAIKMVEGRVFLLDEHLARMAASAELINLKLPMSVADMRNIILESCQIAGQKNAILRLYITRGPGGFTANPYDAIAAQMYLLVTSLKPVAEEKYQQGVHIGKSSIPPKDPWFARIKSCNYLHNVLMKKESVDRQLDFTVGFDAQGVLTESSTENIVLVDKDNILVRPRLQQILKGTTMMRTFELAESLRRDKFIADIQERDLYEEDILSAKEVMMIGTTLDVLPVAKYEEHSIGGFTQGATYVGEVAQKLRELLQEDIKKGPKSTPVLI